MQPSKKSFFERLTGTVKLEEETDVEEEMDESRGILDESDEEGQLTVDVYQTPDEIVLKTMVAGVRPEDLDINITRDMVAIKGKREESAEIHDHDYFHKELYWGSFARTIMLPEEIEVEEAEAIERHGLLTIKLPKVDKSKQNKLRVKSV
ncbi:MAG TPA: Hsp20/alpha crystallin family protein [Candidatus Paceibacterota bacterium]|jgi:HSP20 family protein|nr:Hsp20/alpha crystallin family protein [Candidatus Paceibacterota bacterium]